MEGPTYRFHFFDTSLPIYTGRNKFMLMLEHIRQQLWKQIMLPYKAWSKQCDIVYCNDYFAPYFHFGYKTVQVFHDAFFYEYPQYCNPIWLQLFKRIAVPAARRSAYIITPTEYAKQRVHHFTKIPLDKIVAIHQGPKTIQSATTPNLPEWLPTHQNTPYLLHVGVFEKRKNIPTLLQAFKQLKEAGYPHRLVLVGKGNGKMNSDDTQHILATIESLDLADQVVMPGYIPDEQLGQVYQHASLYVFPSINEGFGIPILEAFQYDVPILVANNTCLPEVGGDAVIQFNPYEATDLFKKISLVLNDPALQATMKEKGRARLHAFNWEKTATQLLAVFEQAIRK
ncbi:glycosyltransferase family 1 protein [Sediminibacterium sp.]|uniref:glycosyltransferase family 4 protein n=1 Tax=Sediminibacterium sp. TaxID=1917865 RepID=UPI0025E8EC9F|nr:glycosyltransferase family 1 protein [Sediminibacterium sp.]